METTCCIKGCEKKVESMGMCINHYRMNKKHGSPVAIRPLSAMMRGKPTEERFWHNVQKMENGCWNWTAGKDSDGYGRFRGNIGSASYTQAHRYSWALHTGEILSRWLFLLHSCDNPSCVNPDHLRTGTAKENSEDMVRKGRQSRGKKHAISHAKFTEEQVRKICADTRAYEVIAEEIGCHKQTIIDMKARRTWTHLKNVVVNRRRKGAGGENRSKNLTEEDVRAIRLSEESGATLAAKYGLSQQSICDIRKGRSWKHIT